MDHNEHTYDGSLGRALLDPEGVGLQEAVLRHTGKRTGATFFEGSKPIDGLWVTLVLCHSAMELETTECSSLMLPWSLLSAKTQSK
jgi:hypothetical protein